MKEFGDWLKEARQKRGITLCELARLSGIDKSNLSRMERARGYQPRSQTVERITKALGLTFEESFMFKLYEARNVEASF